MELGPGGVCVPILECVQDDDCLNIKYCELTNNTCGDPCTKWPCGPNAYGTPIDHRCLCKCIEGYVGNPTDGRIGTTPRPLLPTDSPRPALTVSNSFHLSGKSEII